MPTRPTKMTPDEARASGIEVPIIKRDMTFDEVMNALALADCHPELMVKVLDGQLGHITDPELFRKKLAELKP